jgi:hypothetical protein
MYFNDDDFTIGVPSFCHLENLFEMVSDMLLKQKYSLILIKAKLDIPRVWCAKEYNTSSLCDCI